jgi:hypothetical protein
MANVMRWRYGETNPVLMAVDSATVIEIGDFIYLNTDDALPAADQADGGNEAANQETFHDNFLGVAMQQSAAGDTKPIRVATTGVFEFDAPSGDYEVGELVGVDEDGGGTFLTNQTVAAVAGENLAVGRVVETAGSATAVKVAIVSTVVWGGPQTLM